VVHRDLKPANIMISRRGVAKLMGFSGAQIGGEVVGVEAAGRPPGIAAYASPEQNRRYGPVDARSDLYSLGAVLYEMLTGEPFAHGRIPLADKQPHLPPHIADIVNKLIEEDPRNRYQSATDLMRDLPQLPVADPPPRTGGAADKERLYSSIERRKDGSFAIRAGGMLPDGMMIDGFSTVGREDANYDDVARRYADQQRERGAATEATENGPDAAAEAASAKRTWLGRLIRPRR